jgi:acyl-CoA thioesterase-1
MQSDMKSFEKLFQMNRRYFIASSAAPWLVGLMPDKLIAAVRSKVERRVLILGDSLSAEYGLRRGTGWVALLEKKLAIEKIDAVVINASISGETTSGGRARLPELLATHQPTLLVIELGANDALRGLALAMTQDNLLAMSRTGQTAKARVILLGMQVPPNYGRSYALAFADAYAQTAKASKAALVPFFLKGIADVPDSLKWFQADRIHPREEAHPLILDNVWPEIKQGLQ